MRRSLSGYVERGEVPGLVALVSREDDVFAEAFGTMTVGGEEPVKRSSIFRIASLSKPATAVAGMVLVQEGKMALDDPVSRWLPELADRKVLRSVSSQLDDVVPAKREITVRDLLTLRMGIGSIMAMPDTYPIQTKIREYRIGGDGPPMPTDMPATQEWLGRLASLPLVAQPGERWMYHIGIDVLGVLVSRVSGKPLGEFMRERIFAPLGMKDTGFFVPASESSRLTTCNAFNSQEKSWSVFDGADKSAWGRQPPFESGGAGLVSTVDDYHAFCSMMLNQGRLGGKEILTPESVKMMTSDQLTSEQRRGPDSFLGPGRSWGFGMAVEVERTEPYQTPGRFGWDGGLGTTAYTDPVERMITTMFTSRMMESPNAPKHYTEFWSLAYDARE